MDTLNNNRECLRPGNTSEQHGEVSPCTILILHGNHSPETLGPAQDIPEPINPNVKPPPDEENANVLVVDWDGPDDPQNPKK